MGAYNGEAFIAEQLDSIARQTRLPVELVVCDDASTDSTASIVEAFASTAPFPVRLIRNEENLGIAQNFGKAIGLCKGDVIAIADQDDVWMPGKLATIATAFESNSAFAAVFSDGDLVDEDLTPLGTRLSMTGHIGPEEQRKLCGPEAFAFLLRRNVATGAAMALRARLREIVLPIPDGIATYHDAWIVQIAAATARIAFIPESLMLYRQHPGQQTWDFVYNNQRSVTPGHYAAHLRQLSAMRERLTDNAWRLSMDLSGCVELIDDYILHLQRRSSLPAARKQRLAPIVWELSTGRYTRYSSGWRSALRDLTAIEKKT